ncbi:DNA repair protein RecO [Dyadobacter sandarakinus]|uniref:DNA repair protein RecO n=1 Tax=Dyadobacter sandarakinus TaxID=2747268 RepID=A0ABX7I9J4_9BACT|nr:DNA repair protein RecO [Dyadobacter sandarakinus]QRR02609.1 DNA repair protein RecO [Dyadobacter sandarakinus]
MLFKTRGIVLSYIRYRESSIIARVYTEEFGMQTYVVNGVRSSKSRGNRIALYQPLTLLDMVVYHKNKEDTIHRLSEVKCYAPFLTLPYDIVKSGLALFITEILGKSLREEESNVPLFQFIEDAVLYLDKADSGFENFHIQFLMQLASYLGFGVETVQDLENELVAGRFSQVPDTIERNAISELLTHYYGLSIPLDRVRRVRILEMLIFFYKIHLDSLGEIKSLEVLKEVLR